MRLFDFLFYYSTMWYSTAVTKQYRNPSQQASYVLGISSSLYIYSASILIEYFVSKSFESKIPIWIFMIIGLIIIQLFQYIYITKGRYEKIKESKDKYFKSSISDKKGIRLAVIFGVSGFLLCVFSIIFIHIIK